MGLFLRGGEGGKSACTFVFRIYLYLFEKWGRYSGRFSLGVREPRHIR